ncbi:MAG: RNA polymerase sigma factor [Eubacteriaceae bacterium]
MAKFEEIYSEYFTDVFKYVLSLCQNESMAEEITQETFFKALNNINKFKGDCRIRVWLCQIAKNTYFSIYKKNKNIINKSFEEFKNNNIELAFIDSEISFEIHKALHFLKEPYKEVFSLRVFGELSFLHIAELFNKTESWARVTFHRAKIKLKEDIK